MSSLSNKYTLAKSMNGVNIVEADDVSTENLTVSNIYSSGTSTFLQPPTMSGANITNSTIPITSINDNSNICMLNKTNYFNYPTGYILRSNNSGTGNFYISGADNSIGVDRIGTGVNYNWRLTQTGTLSLRSSSNSFKSWFINDTGGIIRYYNLGGTDSIKLLGDSGEIVNKKSTLTADASSTLSNVLQVNRNYTGSGGGTGHVAINNNGELLFNNGSANTLILEHTGTITSSNWSISSSGNLNIKSITYDGTANNIPLLNQNNTFSGSNTFNAGTTFNSSTYFNDPMYIYDNLDINGSFRNHLSITLDQPYNVLNATQSGANIFFDYTCQTTRLPYLDSGTDGYIFYVSTHPNGQGVSFQSNNDNRLFQPYNTTYFNLNKGECAIIRSCNFQWIVFGDNVRCNGNLSQYITGLKSFEKHPVCESSDALTTYSFTTKAYCDDTYATISGHLTTLMDLSTNQTASGIKIFSGSLQFTNQFVCNNKEITLRDSTDTNNRIVYCGAYTTPKTTSINGVLIEGFEGGLLGLKQGTTQTPFLQWKDDKIYAFKTLFIENSAILETTNAHTTILLQVYANLNTTGYFYVNNRGYVGYYDSGASDYKWNFDNTGNLTIQNKFIAYGGMDLSTTQNITFGSNAPTMSGANISTSSIPYTSINGYANYCYLNVGNLFNAQTTNLTNYIYAINNDNPTGAIFLSNKGYIGYWDGTNNIWTINSSGQAEIKTLNINQSITNTNNSTFNNLGTMKNNYVITITSTSSILPSYSGAKLFINSFSQITLTLPQISGNEGVYFWISGDDTHSTIINSYSGDTIFDGLNYVNTITLAIGQTFFMFIKPNQSWVFTLFSPGGGSDLLNLNNTWNGTNSFNTYLPTSTITPTTSTQLITKGFADGAYITITGDQNITSGIKRFFKPPMLGSETATGLHTKIGYQCGTYYTDATKRAVVIGNNALASNPAGINLLDYAVVIGPYACQNYASAVAQDQLVAIGAFALRNTANGQNTAVGTYAGNGLIYGTENGFFGSNTGGGTAGTTTAPCNRNFIMGSQAMAGNGRVPVGEGIYPGATQTSNVIVIGSYIPNIDAGFQAYFYSSTNPGNQSKIELIMAYDQQNQSITIANTQTILGNSYIGIFSTGTMMATLNYTGATATGTTFTLQGNTTNILSGYRAIYNETLYIRKYIGVSSWNNTTKQIVFTASITLYGGSALLFYDTAQSAQNRGNAISDNCALGAGALMNSATNMSRNCAVGTGALNGVGNIQTYDNRTYISGTDNIGIGYGAGATACIRNSGRNIWIGTSSGQNGYAIAPYKTLNETIALGYSVNTWSDYQCCMANPQNYWYFPTNYKVCFGTTPNINSSRTDYAETGAQGMLQIVCGIQSPANCAISCKAYNDGYSIINFTNTTGVVRGAIAGVNSTSVSYNTTSDERLKENIIDMDSQLDNIQKLKPRKFNWKSSGEEDTGFIAQEYYKIYPERTNHKNLYPEEMLGMDYGRCTPYLWKGMSELIDLVKQQQEQINELKNILKNNNLM